MIEETKTDSVVSAGESIEDLVRYSHMKKDAVAEAALNIYLKEPRRYSMGFRISDNDRRFLKLLDKHIKDEKVKLYEKILKLIHLTRYEWEDTVDRMETLGEGNAAQILATKRQQDMEKIAFEMEKLSSGERTETRNK